VAIIQRTIGFHKRNEEKEDMPSKRSNQILPAPQRKPTGRPTKLPPNDVLQYASNFLTLAEQTDAHLAGLVRTRPPPLDEVVSLGELADWAQQPETAERLEKVTRLIIHVDAQSPHDNLSRLPDMPSLRGIKLNITGFPPENDWMQHFVRYLPWNRVQTLLVCTVDKDESFNEALVQILGQCTTLQHVALRAAKDHTVEWSPEVISALSGRHAVVEVHGGNLPVWSNPNAPGPRAHQLDLDFKYIRGNRNDLDQPEFWPPILRSAEVKTLRLFIKDDMYGGSCHPTVLRDAAIIAAQRQRDVLVAYAWNSSMKLHKLVPLCAYVHNAKIRLTVDIPGVHIWVIPHALWEMNLQNVSPTRMELEFVIDHPVNIDTPSFGVLPAKVLQRYNFLTLRYVFRGLPAEYARMAAHADYRECFRLFPGRLIIENAAPLSDNNTDEQREWEKDLGTTNLNEYKLCNTKRIWDQWVAARLEGSRNGGWHLGAERPVCRTLKLWKWTTKLCHVVRATPKSLPVTLSRSRKLVHLSTLPGEPCMYIATVRRSRSAGSDTGYYMVYNPRDRQAAATKVSQMPNVTKVPSRHNQQSRAAPVVFD
jgi:hypothetical protein